MTYTRADRSQTGTANYDIGHTFTLTASGLAAIRSACNDQLKGQGESALSIYTPTQFGVEQVAHEIGHQMGANHTFNGVAASACSDDTHNPNTAFEVSSGITVMGYTRHLRGRRSSGSGCLRQCFLPRLHNQGDHGLHVDLSVRGAFQEFHHQHPAASARSPGGDHSSADPIRSDSVRHRPRRAGPSQSDVFLGGTGS